MVDFYDPRDDDQSITIEPYFVNQYKSSTSSNLLKKLYDFNLVRTDASSLNSYTIKSFVFNRKLSGDFKIDVNYCHGTDESYYSLRLKKQVLSNPPFYEITSENSKPKLNFFRVCNQFGMLKNTKNQEDFISMIDDMINRVILSLNQELTRDWEYNTGTRTFYINKKNGLLVGNTFSLKSVNIESYSELIRMTIEFIRDSNFSKFYQYYSAIDEGSFGKKIDEGKYNTLLEKFLRALKTEHNKNKIEDAIKWIETCEDWLDLRFYESNEYVEEF